MKKIIVIFMCFAMMLAVSCSGETLELLDFIDKNSELVTDLDGKTFTFASMFHSEWYAFPDETLPSESVEKMMTRFHSIEEKYHAKFEMVQTEQDEILKFLITGDETPEMFDMLALVAYDLYKSNILSSLNQFSVIDLSDTKWGVPNFIKYGNFDGEQYGFYPWHWEFTPQFEGAVIFNAEMISKYGGTHPYELQESGNWNWDNFEQELSKYSVFDNDLQHYGVVGDTEKIARAAIFSNGGQMIEGDKDSGYTFGVKSEKSTQALDWVKGLYDSGVYLDSGYEDFTVQKLAPYYVGHSYIGTVFNANDATSLKYAPAVFSDYGFIPFPVGPQGDSDDVGAYVYRHRRLNFISDIADIESNFIAEVINYIFEPLDGSTEEGWKPLVKDFVFTENNNDKCYENFIFAIENLAYDYSVQMGPNGEDELNLAFDNIIKGIQSQSEAFDALEEMILTEINK